MKNIRVKLGALSYTITIGRGAIRRLPSGLQKILATRKIVVVTNRRMSRLYRHPLQKMLRKKFDLRWLEIPEGEQTKKLPTVERVCQKLTRLGADRQTGLVALGGGVIGDITGLVAALYMRGIPYIQVPTTLLAQVDSSVGGKTAVDLPEGKNLVGAFYQPRWVVIDTKFLKTLPRREFLCGMSEIVKYGLLAEAPLFRFIEKNAGKILSLHHNTLKFLIERSCSIKASIVSRDEKENGPRSLLNLGHTLGHAIEALDGYRRIKHGEAISRGMVYAAHLSVKRGLLQREDLERIKNLFTNLGLPVRWPSYPKKSYRRVMAADKKTRGGKIRFVALKRIGQAVVLPLSIGEVTEYL